MYVSSKRIVHLMFRLISRQAACGLGSCNFHKMRLAPSRLASQEFSLNSNVHGTYEFREKRRKYLWISHQILTSLLETSIHKKLDIVKDR